MTSIPRFSKNIRSHRRAISVVAAVLVLGVVAASFIAVHGRAAGLGFRWPASLTKIFATPKARNLSPATLLAASSVVAPGTLAFSAANYNDSETNSGSHPVTITVSRSGGTDGAVSVDYSVTDGTAQDDNPVTEDNDYSVSPPTGQLNWADTEGGDKSFTVTVNGDAIYEANETVNLTLSAPTGGATLGSPSSATLTITNDDAPPATLVVNTTNDVDDGLCDVTHCSLREAINAANFSSDTSTINFNIPNTDPGFAGGVYTIQPTPTALPALTRRVTIDGTSQTAFGGDTNVNGPEVVINGGLLSGSPNGFIFGASNIIIKGLVINGFGTGIGGAASNYQILDNYIGTDATGTVAVPNAGGGLGLGAGSGSTVSGNLISGNGVVGISTCDVTSTTFSNNKIGTDRTGTGPLGNGSDGFRTACTSFALNTISNNIIAFNGADGFLDLPDFSGTFHNHIRNRLSQNSIFSNGGLGINLNPPPDNTNDGVTANDAQDADIGSNNLQNFPVITSAKVTGTTYKITGTLNTTPNSSGSYTIEFFSNPVCNGNTAGVSSGTHGEGKTYLGSIVTGTTDANGDVAFTFNSSTAFSVGDVITATAREFNFPGDTSEFSSCVTAVAGTPGSLQFSAANYNDTEQNSSTHTATITVQRIGGSDGPASVHYATSDGATNGATAGSDYDSASGDFNWADGDGSDRTFTVTVHGDTTVEADEIVDLTLSSATGASIAGTNPATLTIVNDDADVSVAVSPSSSLEDTGSNLVYTFTRTGVTTGSLTANFSVSGTANSSDDYSASGAASFTPPTGSVTFGSGIATVDVTIDPTTDISYEPNETVVLTVTTGTGYSVGSSNVATGTITDDDAIPTSLTVTKTADTDDGFCSVDDCSLREAISNANAASTTNTIGFNIPMGDPGRDGTTGVYTITPGSALPAISNPVTIDGYTQTPCSGPNPAPCSQKNTLAEGNNAVILIELDGTNAGSTIGGLNIVGPTVTVKGLAINRFAEGAGILLQTNGNTVQGNFIGTDAAGTAAQPNAIGIFVLGASNNLIGTNADAIGDEAERNTISGNLNQGVLLAFASSSNTVAGNYIGTNSAGASAIPNAVTGITIASGSSTNTIGGLTAAARNVISGNKVAGVGLSEAATTGNGIKGNYIGVGADGTTAVGNTSTNLFPGDGILFYGAAPQNNTVGGTTAGEGNLIANNVGAGVDVQSGTGNNITGNSMGSNGGLGIDLENNGVTANDASDADTGANNLQNFPVLSYAVTGTAPSPTTTINGSLNSTASTTFIVEFFSNTTCDSLGNGEGQTYIGSLTNVTTDASGDANFIFTPSTTVAAGQFITATATDPSGNTSEFSACRQVLSTGAIEFSSPTYTVGENGTTASITVIRTGGSGGAVSATFNTSDGWATAGSDYTAVTSHTVSFADGDAEETVSIPINDDTIFEGNETVNLALSSPVGGAVLGTQTSAMLTITENEAQPTISISDVTLAEGNAGTTDFVFTLSLSHQSTQTITVKASTANGTATAGSDYTAVVDQSVSFAPLETSKNVTVQVSGDTTIESDEQFNVNLSNAVNATTTDQGVGTITNDDTAVTVTVSPGAVAENGSTNLVYTFTRNPLTSGPITVNFSVGGTATLADSDYTQTGAATFTATSGTVTILNGNTTATVTIDPEADGAVEPDETVSLTVTSGTGYNIGGANSATGTITNDDTDVAVAVSPSSAVENDTVGPPVVNPVMVYTFTRTGVTTGAITVNFSASGTASPSDYVLTNAASFNGSTGTVTFGSGEVTKTVTVDPTNDAVYESNETVVLTVTSGTGYEPADSPNNSATGTITNDDPKPTLGIGDVIAFEGNTGGPTNFVFTVTKSGPTQVTASVNFDTADGSTNPATGGGACGGSVDYVSQTGGLLTFLPNETTKTITIAVCRETAVEANETFFVNLSNESEATITDGEGRGTIQNDDSPGTVVTVNTTNDLVDGAGCDGTHCSLREAIPAANGSLASVIGINFSIPASDSRHFYYKDDGVVNQVTLTNVAPTTTPDDSTLVGALIDPIDPDWPHSWWSILPTSPLPSITHQVVVDGATQTGWVANTLTGATNAVLRVELSGESAGAGATGLLITTSTSTVRGLVINRFTSHGLDLQGGTSNSLVGNFIGTDVSGTLDLGNTLNGISTTGNSLTIGGSSPGEVNLISGNNADGISFSNSNSDLVLGNLIGTKANGLAALGNGGNGISFSGLGSAFNTIGGIQPGEGNTISFNGGDGVQVPASAGIGNAIRGNSIFSNGTTNLHLGIDLDADGVTANDAADPDPSPSPSRANNLQNFPLITLARKTGSTGTITGTLNSKVGETFDIDFYASASCDNAGNGEGQTYLGTVTTAATDGSGNVAFTFHPDSSHAAAMTAGKVVTATATSTGASFSTSEFSACVTVVDGGIIGGGAGDIQFDPSQTYLVAENDLTQKYVVKLKREGGTNGQIQTTFSASSGSATAGSDFTAITNQVVVFDEGETSKTVDVLISDDAVYEGNETVNLSLGTSQLNVTFGKSKVTAASPYAAVLTITDNETKPTLSIDDVTHNEGNSGTTAYTFTITKTGSTAVNATVDYATVNGTATAPSDFTAISTTTLTFLPGEISKQVTVFVNGDTTVEAGEAFTVHLSNAINATISDADGAATITNDDTDVTVAVSPSAVAEDGATNLVYTFTRNGITSGALTVNFSVGGTAAFGTDYAQTGAATFGPTSGTVTFGAGNSTTFLTIDPSIDSTVESNDTAILTVTTGPGYNVASPSAATGTITNDDTDVTVVVSPSAVAEDLASNLVYTFTRNGVNAGSLTVNFSVGGTAAFGTDYAQTGATTFGATAGTVTFAAGNSTATVTIDPSIDSTVESNETAILTVTTGPGYNVASPSAATGTITNDDTDVTVVVSPSAVAEDGAPNLVYTFTRNGVTSGALTANFSVGGAATFSTDYTQTGATTFTSSAGTVVFGAGNSTATVTIDPTTDLIFEPDETVILTVTSGTGYNFASPSSATGTITNDEAARTLSIDDVSHAEGNSGTTTFAFTVTLSGQSSQTVGVDFATAPGTATAGSDYVSNSGTLTFAPLETTKTINISVNGDLSPEPNETFFVNLTNASNATIADNQGQGTIVNDDVVGFQFEFGNYSVQEGIPSISILVKRVGDTSNAATVDYATNDFTGVPATDLQPAHCEAASNTASSKCDYVTAGGRLRFAAGETQKTVVLSIIDDIYVEGDETLSMTLSNPSAGNLVSPSTAVITIQSNDTNQNATGNDNPYLINNFFVRQQYLDFLLREPDTNGFNDWVGVLNNCQPNQGGLGSDPGCDRVHVTSGFFRSPEFGERGYWVYRFFTASLGRRPLYAEFMPEMRRLSGLKPQSDLDKDESDFINEFMQRSEFTTIYTGITDAGHASAFIGKLEEKAGVALPETVPPTQAGQPQQYGRSELIGLMQNGTLSPAQTLRAFVEQKTVWDAYFFKAFVAMEYFGYLRRDPENAGYDDWVDVLINGRGTHPPGDFRHLVFGFIYSEEYRERFGPK